MPEDGKNIKGEEKMKLIAYTDGSYDKKTKNCSLGVVLLNGDEVSDNNDHALIEMIKQRITDTGYCNMRNVGGEILAAVKAMEYAVGNKYDQLDIYFDYNGIEKWPTRKWKCNNEYTENYVKFYDECAEKIKIVFHHVKGHSHDTFNDLADILAKDALDLYGKNIKSFLVSANIKAIPDFASEK